VRGRIHGETLRHEIAALTAIWKDALGRYGLEPDRFIEEFLQDTRFDAAARRWTPGLWDEVGGIAEGANCDPSLIRAFQCIDEEWWYGRNRHHGIEPPRRRDGAGARKCSVLGVFGQEGAPAILAQNLDLMTYFDGYQVLLHTREIDSDLESFTLTSPGYIGMTGLNNRSLGVCVNALLQLDQRIDGLPVAFVVRGILEQESFDAAVRFVRTIDHASGQAYTIGCPERIATFECSANTKPRCRPTVSPTRLCHTNHPLASDDRAIHDRLMDKVGAPKERTGPTDSEVRMQSLEKRLSDRAETFTVETARAALGSHDDPAMPVCRHGPGAFTFGCVVMELTDPPSLHLSPGPACRTEAGQYRF
jgi:hypothetical protein